MWNSSACHKCGTELKVWGYPTLKDMCVHCELNHEQEWMESWFPAKKIKCECGADKVQQDTRTKIYHSYWCPKYEDPMKPREDKKEQAEEIL